MNEAASVFNKIRRFPLALLIFIISTSVGATQYDDFEKQAAPRFQKNRENVRIIEAELESGMRAEFKSIISLGYDARTYEKVRLVLRRLEIYLASLQKLKIRIQEIQPYDNSRRESHLIELADYAERAKALMLSLDSISSVERPSASMPSFKIEHREYDKGGILKFTGECGNGKSFAGSWSSVYSTMPYGACGPNGCHSGVTPEDVARKACGE